MSALRDRMIERFGPSAGPWCDALPGILRELSARWRLRLGTEMSGGTACVYRGTGPGGAVVLKLTPDPVIAREEAAALRAWADSPRAAGLLDADLGHGALLIEGLSPGTPLRESATPVALPEIAELVHDLHAVPVPAERLPSLSERLALWFPVFERRRATVARELDGVVLERCRVAAAELVAGDTLLHGDLHAANVLDAGPHRGAVAIDPRPCVGDGTFDVIDWAYDGVCDEAELPDRCAELARLIDGLAPDRLLRWCHVVAPLLAIAGLMRDERGPRTRMLLRLSGTV